MELYFKDNFFNAGITEIMDAAGARIGYLDLKSAMGSSLDVFDQMGKLIYSGRFRFFTNRWQVFSRDHKPSGVLKARFSFFSKRFIYQARSRGDYEIHSPAFSKDYEVRDQQGNLVATFSKINNWLEASAFCLHNKSAKLDSYELVTVVMGVHEIRKRQRSAAAT